MNKKSFIVLRVICALAVPACAHSASGEDIYKAKCSACHDSGAGQAPRINVRADWPAREARGRNAMYESAIKGIAATAMGAKGGFAELSDAEVRQTVDYMLARAGFRETVAVPQTVPAPAAPLANGARAAEPVDDVVLVNRVAEALQKALAPGARVELHAGEAILRGVTIRVSVLDGVVTLSGAVEKSDWIPRALALTHTVPGVKRVDSKLVAAGMFDFD